MPPRRRRLGSARRRSPPRLHPGRRQRERGEHDIEYKDFGHDRWHRKAVVGGALVEVRAMCGPERLAADNALEQRQGRIRQIIERQK